MDSSEPQALPRWKRWIFGSVTLLVILSLFEIGARIGLRKFRGFDGEHLYQYEFDPYRNISPTPGFVDTRGVRHNSVGFRRSTEVSVAKPDGTYRIFLMGASTAYGLGGLWTHIDRSHPVLTNSETIDAYLESMLVDSLPGVRVEVINAAVTSTWTHHNLIYLNQRILRYSPDMILFLDGFNDFFLFDATHDQFSSYSYGLPSRVIMGEPTIYALAYANAWWLFRKSAAAHLASRTVSGIAAAIRSPGNRLPIDVPKAVTSWNQVFEQNALKMHERIGLILRAESVRAVFMLQPFLILERDRVGMPAVERELFEFNVSSYLPGYEQYMHRVVPLAIAKETEMASRVGASFVDLSQPFNGVVGQVYTDYAHLTPEGNRLIAQRILNQTLPGIRADLRAP